MKKEVFILCSDPPEQLGGVEACVREHVRGFQQLGYAVRVWHRANTGSRLFKKLERMVSRHLTDGLAGYFIGRAAQKAMHPDVVAVFSHSVVGWYPLRLPSGCKQFHLYHGTYRGQAEAIRPFISHLGYLKLKWWDSMVLERMSGKGKQVFSCSELIRIEVERLFHFKSITLGYPLDMTDFRPRDQQECRAKFELPLHGVIGVYAGTTQPNKNFPVIQRLIRDLPQVTWVLAIRGESHNGNEFPHNVRVIPNVPRNLIPELYAAADFTVCPSRYDPFPYVVTEALGCGLPVLSSLNGSSHTFLRESPLNRLIVLDPNDLDGFVAAGRDLVGNLDFFRKAIMEQVRPAVERWMKPENFWKRFGEITGL
jgi:glycosyltransferase involved in cell wall biosynthesis